MVQVKFRVSDERLAFIDRAAAIRGVARTEFVFRSSEAAAVETVNERPDIALDDETCDAGAAALDAPDGAGHPFEGTFLAPAVVGTIAAPELLGERHGISQFRSGVPGLDAWLQGKARLNEAKGGARTYVARDGDRVVGFYSLAASSAEVVCVCVCVVEGRQEHARAGSGDPARQLAVDADYQARGLGSDLLVARRGERWRRRM